MQLLSDPFSLDWKRIIRLTWFQVEKMLEMQVKKNNANNPNKVPEQAEIEVPTLEEFIAGLKKEHPERTKEEWYAMYSRFIKGLK